MAILVFEHSDHSGIDRLGRALSDFGHRLRTIRLHDGDDVPSDLDDVDGVISCGGPHAAYDDALPWLEPQMQIMREALELDLPVLGLCLGSQILARALGGKVEKMSTSAIEFGFTEVNLSPVGREDCLFAGQPWSEMMMQSHRDHVAQLPPGARLLASSARCKVQAWAHGLRAYGMQYHPEVDADRIEEWIASDGEALRDANMSADVAREQVRSHYPTFERLTDRLFEAIGLLLMPVDRRYRGLVKDLHH